MTSTWGSTALEFDRYAHDDAPVLELVPPTHDGIDWATSDNRRAVDLIVALLLLPIAAVLILVTAVVSAVAFKAWPFFTQERRGQYDQTIRVLKIRSLPTSFPARLGKHDMEHHRLGPWSTFIRTTHLDELPQILNVITGSLSLVGPRPMIDEVLSRLDPHDRALRSTVRPGMTGAWQISTMGRTALDACPQLDRIYVQRATWRTDAWLLWRTALSALGGPALRPDEILDRF